MGASSRAAGTIEPANADLLIPDRPGSGAADRKRDIEDARFEPVAPAGTGGRSFSADGAGGFKAGFARRTRAAPPDADLSLHAPDAGPGTIRGERLGGFAAMPPARSASGPKALRGLALAALGLCAFAAAAVWATAGPDGRAPVEASRAIAGASGPPQVSTEQASSMPQVSSDPLTTASLPHVDRKPSAPGFSAPLPRPARIERAGSILMIRPQTN
ncbi:hypothetical protein [Hoeflea olei]|nr:hypothetical protein [Hoeflea olei]